MTRYQRIARNPLVAAILETWPGAVITVKDPTPIEIEGMIEAGHAGGEYLEAIGKSDLAALSHDEYMGFIEKVIRAYEDKTMLLYCGPNGEAPF